MPVRRLLSLLTTLAIAASLTSCGKPDPLRVESAAPPSVQPLTVPEQSFSEQDYDEWEKPFGPAQASKAIATSDLSPLKEQGSDTDEILQYVLTCAECVTPHPAYEINGERFQIYSVNTMGDGFSFASFAIRDDNGAPKVALAVGGSDVYLSTGNGGSLVAQEAVYKKDDPMCCPSGWSVRMFRYQNGEFVPGEHFSSSYSPIPTEGAGS